MDTEYIKSELESLTSAERSKRADELASFYNVSRQTIWRKANAAGLRIRADKADKGVTQVSDKALELIAARVSISKRLKTGDFTNTVKKAYNDLISEGVEIPVGYQRVCTLLKARGLDKESLSLPSPHVQLISLHPNHVHQFDVTNCLQWHFKNKGGLAERDVDRMFYKNKLIKNAKSIKQELLRYVLIDHCSGAFFVWYYYTSGERAEDGADFFYRAWAEKASLIESTLGLADYSGAYQFQGVPKMLVSDKGSILIGKIMKNLMATLGVQVELHMAGNPRAKGMVEGLMKIIGYEFESNLRRYNIDCLEDLNRFALDWCIERNCKAPFRQALPRARYWLKIKPNELRICPDEVIYKKLQHKPQETRKCDGNCIISYVGRRYKCPDVNAAHRKVVVMMNAYEYPAVDIHYNGMVHVVTPLEIDEYGRYVAPDAVPYGEYRAHKLTNIEKAKTRLEQVAAEEWGVGFKGNKDKRRAVSPTTAALPDQITKQDNIIFLKAEGVSLETPNIHAPLTEEAIIPIFKPRNVAVSRFVPVSEVIRMYMTEYGKLTKEQNQKLKELYPNGVPTELTITDVFNAINIMQEERTDAKSYAS